MKSHAVPEQVVSLAPVGLGHARQDEGPQVSTLVFEAQIPLQLCDPPGHCPEQAAAMSMQPPRHSFIPMGHVGTHAAPSQLTMPPPVGVWHAEHDVLPQLATSVFFTHRPRQL